MKLMQIMCLFLAVVILDGCAMKTSLLRKDMDYSEFLKLTKEANAKATCAYSGRISVNFKTEGSSAGFSGIIDKACSDDIKLSILGPFNVVFAQIGYKNGVVSVKTSDNQSAANIKSFATFAIEELVPYMRYPLYLLDENGRFTTEDGYYLYDAGYDKNNIFIRFDSDFRVVGYTIEGKISTRLDYRFSEVGALSEIILTKDDDVVIIKLLNPSGWSFPK